MSFAAGALGLAGVSARLLGWTPDTFWAATPAELAACLGEAGEGGGGEAADRAVLDALRAQFPDGKD